MNMISWRQVGRRWMFGFILAAGAWQLCAQEPAAPQPPTTSKSEPLEEVIVTGTRIRRTEAEGALPVQIVDAEAMQRSGAGSIEQVLQSVTAAMQGNSNTVSSMGSGATTGGVSGVSLRGLGSQRTLALLDGKRLPGGGTITDSTTVDVNNIPVAALERVEVLKDGASAIYGSDAIGGVVNFILRRNFEGLELNATGGASSDGGATGRRFSAMGGIGNLTADRYNVLLVASYQDDDSLYGAQRSFAKSGISIAADGSYNNDTTSGNTFPANFTAADGSFGTYNPKAPASCAPSLVDPNFPPSRCRFDPSPMVSLLPPTQRYGLFSSAHFALSDDTMLYANASYNHSKQQFIIQPVPLSDQFALPSNNVLYNQAPYYGSATILLQPSSPFYPTSFVQSVSGGPTPDLLVRFRSFITGNRDLTDTSEQPRVLAGVQGTAVGWDYDIAAMYSQTKLTEHDNNGYPIYSKILPLLNSGMVNFFGPNTQDIMTQADATNFRGDAYSTTTSVTGIDLSGTRALMNLPAGELAVALGVDLRKEKFTTNPSAEILTGDLSGYGGNFLPVDQSRNVTGIYAEGKVPLLSSLEADLAVRYDDYQNTGSKTVPKVSLAWRPIRQLLLRGAYGKGFRAPSLSELYQPQVLGVTSNGLNDPERCGKTDSNGNVNESSLDCATQFNTTVGGYPKLVPEESTNYTLGVVVEPVPNVSIGIDGFKIELDQTIIFGVNPSAILADTAQFGSFVTRGPPDPSTPGLPGHITNINQLNLNFGTTKLSGFDVDARLSWRLGSAGTIKANLTGTYISTYDIQNPDGSFSSVAGKVSPITNGNGGTIPRWHHNLVLAWALGSWELSATNNFQSSYQDMPGTFDDPTDPSFKYRTVGSYNTYDFLVYYSGFKDLRLGLGARNAFNQDPPYTNAGGQNYFQAGYDPGYADPRGRYIWGTATYTLGRR